MLKIKQITTSGMSENCYILTDSDTGLSAIIDPGDDEVKISIATQTLNVKYILLTHGHYDHIWSVKRLRQFHSGAQVGIHTLEQEWLTDPQKNLSSLMGKPVNCGKPDFVFDDGDVIELGETQLHVLHTPGHTCGSACFVSGKDLFAGDTLFFESVGRTDLPTGNSDDLEKSVKNKLYSLSDDTKVYPGHMRSTTIGYEKKNNSYVRL